MKISDKIHGSYIFPRRVRVLSEYISKLIPPDAVTLDIGCGDGLISWHLLKLRPDISITGIDVLVRPESHIPVRIYDGITIPYKDKSVDTIIFVDVLHHTDNPKKLIIEAGRVSRKTVIIKDHFQDGFLSKQRLKFMDKVGNRRHNVFLPYNYMKKKEWEELYKTTNFVPEYIETKLSLYPRAIDWLFGRSLHFIAKLAPLSYR